MNKKNPKIKTEYTLKLQDEIDASEVIASVFFRDMKDENGNTITVYTPYLEKVGQVNAIAKYFIEGVEFDDAEDIYETVMEDKDIRPLIDEFLDAYQKKYEDLSFHQKIFADVMENAYDIVEYRKAMNIAQMQNRASSALIYKLLAFIDQADKEMQNFIKG